MAIRPVRLWQHVVNHVESAGLYHAERFVQSFVLAGHRICTHEIETARRRLCKKDIASSAIRVSRLECRNGSQQ
jgi:hypothetical protein